MVDRIVMSPWTPALLVGLGLFIAAEVPFDQAWVCALFGVIPVSLGVTVARLQGKAEADAELAMHHELYCTLQGRWMHDKRSPAWRECCVLIERHGGIVRTRPESDRG